MRILGFVAAFVGLRMYGFGRRDEVVSLCIPLSKSLKLNLQDLKECRRV